MAERPLNESFDTSGEWYLPEAPERTIAGGLHYAPERIELHLHEAFRPLQGAIHVGDFEQVYPVIHGTTRNSEAMTLLNAQRIGATLNFGSGGLRRPERLISSLLLIGAHAPHDYSYPEMRFRVPGLPIWLSRQIIEQSHDRDEATASITLSYRVRGLAEEITRVPSINANLKWGISRNSKVNAFTSIAVTVSGWVTIQPDAAQPIEWFFDQMNKVTTMLTFLAGTPMSPDCIQASIDEDHHEISVMMSLRETTYCQYTNFHEFYMPRGTMRAELADVVARWFEVYPQVHMPSQLALSVLASEKLWLHVEFLSLMQALEGFHRGLFDGNYMDETEYKAVKKALGDAIPAGLASDHKDALRSRIKYGNQISLGKRLDVLTEIFSEPICGEILGEDGKVPRSWIDTRNYYTHWDEELRANVLEGQDMYNATVRMRHFLRALYLNLMGIPEAAILESLNNASDSSQHLVQLNFNQRGHNNS